MYKRVRLLPLNLFPAKVLGPSPQRHEWPPCCRFDRPRLRIYRISDIGRPNYTRGRLNRYSCQKYIFRGISFRRFLKNGVKCVYIYTYPGQIRLTFVRVNFQNRDKIFETVTVTRG